MSTGRIGFWISEEKKWKLKNKNFEIKIFENMCREAGYELVELDLDKCLDSQGPFDVLLHKVSDLFFLAKRGIIAAKEQLIRFTNYVERHPEIFVVDSLDGVFTLLDRGVQYNMLLQCFKGDADLFTPSFVELTSAEVTSVRAHLDTASIAYPFVCKPSVADGSKQAHTMCVIFNEDGLKDVTVPSVAQTFITHNAVLYKVFVIGDVIRVLERPSLRNLDPSANKETIFFNSHDVSKPHCCTDLNQLTEADEAAAVYNDPPLPVLERLVRCIRAKTKLNMLSIDLIVEKETDKCAVIDVNCFPGYEGVPDFYSLLLDFLRPYLAAPKPQPGAASEPTQSGCFSASMS